MKIRKYHKIVEILIMKIKKMKNKTVKNKSLVQVN